MRFLVDAQLPAKLVTTLNSLGHDAVHVSSLPHGVQSSDHAIACAADAEARTVITKDKDFRNSHLLVKQPRSLLLVAIGNTTNDELIDLFRRHIGRIAALCGDNAFVEINRAHLLTR